MKQSAIFLVCTVLALASALDACEIPNDWADYLDWSPLPSWYKENSGLFLRALRKINAAEGDPVETIFQKIDEVYERDDTESDEESIYTILKSLALPEEEVTFDVIHTVLKISEILNEPSNGLLKSIFPYLKRYAGEKFGVYVRGAIDRLDLGPPRQEGALRELDKFFAACFEMSQPTHDNLLNSLRQTSFESIDFNPIPGIVAIQNPHVSTQTNPINFFYNFMEKSCHGLQSLSRFPLHVITLADTYGYIGQYPDKVLKIKEYNRLCLSLRRPEKILNIKTNIENRMLGRRTVEKGQSSRTQ